jgi:hypothetical protein
MKIELELLNEPRIFDKQMMVVNKYIEENTIKLETNVFLGITISENPVIRETPKNTGVKIEIENCWRKFHVSCRKTKGGIYKFKVWNA